MKHVFEIEGLHCASCAMLIDGTLEDVEGVAEASTSFARGCTEVTFDPGRVSLETLAAAVESVGYKVRRGLKRE